MQTIDIGTFCRELLHNVFSDLGNKAGDLGVEAIPGVDVTVAEAEAGGEREEAEIVLAGLPGLLVQPRRKVVWHYGVILR